MKTISIEKYKKFKPNKFSYFRENMKLLLNTYPQCYEKLGMFRKLVSNTRLDPDQFKEVILKSKEIKLPYSPIGYVINQMAKNKKEKPKELTLFG